MQNIWIYTNLKHTLYMCKYRAKQDLIVLKLDSVSINKILITKFVTVKVSQNLNLMQSLSTQWNQQLIRYVFSRVIECLEQNIRKQIDCKRPSNTRKMNWLQKIQIEMRKYKVIENFKIYTFFINNQKFRQSPRKSLFLHKKTERNAHFWTCQFKSALTYSRCPCNKLWQRLECLNI